jgi:peptidoglycan/xylan/chitin deacetylase (PgdA/CDA1 family)
VSAGPQPPFSYLPLPDRPPLTWPGGARVAVWVAVNTEHYPIDRPGLSIVPITAQFVPDPMNYGWRDYGARVGIWRLMDVLEELAIPVTAPLHEEVCHRYPQIIEAGNERGWAWMAHGRDNAAAQVRLEEDERAYLTAHVDALEQLTGRRPRGWLGPALTETFDTPELLAELGLEYVCDWCNDDQPYPLETSAAPLISLPYSIEVNDIPLLLDKGMTGAQYRDLLIDQLEGLYELSAGSGTVMAIPLHPFLVGLPFRLRYLRQALEQIAGHEGVWMATGDEIAAYYLEHHYAGARAAASAAGAA